MPRKRKTRKTLDSPVRAVERGPLGATGLAGGGDLLGRRGLLGLGDDLKKKEKKKREEKIRKKRRRG